MFFFLTKGFTFFSIIFNVYEHTFISILISFSRISLYICNITSHFIKGVIKHQTFPLFTRKYGHQMRLIQLRNYNINELYNHWLLLEDDGSMSGGPRSIKLSSALV